MSFTQSTFVIFSSVSLALIAVDRMLVIVYPDLKQMSNKQVKKGLCWILSLNLQAFLLTIFSSFFCAIFYSPLFFMTKMIVIFEDASYCYVSWKKENNHKISWNSYVRNGSHRTHVWPSSLRASCSNTWYLHWLWADPTLVCAVCPTTLHRGSLLAADHKS